MEGTEARGHRRPCELWHTQWPHITSHWVPPGLTSHRCMRTDRTPTLGLPQRADASSPWMSLIRDAPGALRAVTPAGATRVTTSGPRGAAKPADLERGQVPAMEREAGRPGQL